jgi:hypothetical protein
MLLLHFRCILLYYKSVAPYCLLINTLAAVLLAQFGAGTFGALFPLKYLTMGVLIFHYNSARSRDFWMFYNLGLSKRKFWAWFAALDLGIFILFLTLGYQLCKP